jgi:hypothetical protein
MRRFICLSVLGLAAIAPLALCAQDPARLVQDVRPPVVVQTFNLRWISSMDAANLVSPYVQTPGNPSIGAFSAGPNMHAITVRGTKAMIATVDSILRVNDRQPPTLVLKFQLIAGLDSAATRDPAIADVDAALRGLFRFNGYKLLAQGSSTVGDDSQFLLTMASGSYRYQVSGRAHTVQATGGTGSAELNVGLGRQFAAAESGNAASTPLFSTGLTVTLGQTVVLGSAAGSLTGQALILTVHTELAPPQEP